MASLLSISGSVYLSYQSVLVLGANTEPPDQSDGGVTRFLIGRHFAKYAPATGPLLADAGNPGMHGIFSDEPIAAPGRTPESFSASERAQIEQRILAMSQN